LTTKNSARDVHELLRFLHSTGRCKSNSTHRREKHLNEPHRANIYREGMVLVGLPRTPRHLALPSLTLHCPTSPTSPHVAPRRSTSSHIAPPRPASPHLVPPRPTSPHLATPRPTSPNHAPPCPTSPHLAPPRRTSPYLPCPTSPHLARPRSKGERRKARLDSAGLGYSWLGSVGLVGLARLDSGKLGWARLDSVGLGYARLDSLGSGGLGWTRLASFGLG